MPTAGPGFASFIVRDAQGMLHPAPAKRLAPDFPFQPQVYRGDGESLRLPDGRSEVLVSGGPEYSPLRTTLEVGPNRSELSVSLRRSIDPAARGWYRSGSATSTPPAAVITRTRRLESIRPT